jgi:DNA mismatch endonuclease (patch repair protein)
MDTFSREQRSAIMRRVRSSDTAPELLVRRLLHRCGFRFRLHDAKLPGKPDIVLPKHRTAVFIHGCFWHRHVRCKEATTPQSNIEYWEAKFARNQLRDRRVRLNLRRLGWKVIVVWECQLRKPERLLARLLDAIPREATARAAESPKAATDSTDSTNPVNL